MKKETLLLGALSLLCAACHTETDAIKADSHCPTVPILTHRAAHPVCQVQLHSRQPGTAFTLEQIDLSLKGTTRLQDIKNLRLFAADARGRMDTSRPLTPPLPPAQTLHIRPDSLLRDTAATLWIAVQLNESADLTHRYAIACKSVRTSSGRVQLPKRQEAPLRAGVAVRQHGQDGVHTSRIPGLATSRKGTLLAIYDARYESARDLQGHIDICLNRSTDGGRTWKPMQVVLDMGQWGGLPEKYNGVSDANILVDEKTGDIYVAGLWMHGVLDPQTGKWQEGLTEKSKQWNHQWRKNGSQPGFGVKETSQFLITKSTDDGLTWGPPVNITRQCKRPEWWLYAPAPGHGITLADGTLVIPTQGRDRNGTPFSNITWSKDNGRTWTASQPACDNVTECMAAELSDGTIMLNMRDNRNGKKNPENGRHVCITDNLGATWTEHPTSRKALIEPVCMGSLHRHDYHRNGKKHSLLLFANPDSRTARNRITLKVSYDDGNTWPEEKKILLDEYGGFGYSCITSIDENTIGILYEGSQCQLVFQQIPLSDLLP